MGVQNRVAPLTCNTNTKKRKSRKQRHDQQQYKSNNQEENKKQFPGCSQAWRDSHPKRKHKGVRKTGGSDMTKSTANETIKKGDKNPDVWKRLIPTN